MGLSKYCLFIACILCTEGFFLSANVSTNIRSLLDGKALTKYKAGNAAMFVPIGRHSGVGQLPNGMVVGDFATKKIKGQDLFISRQWKSMKQSAPR